VPELLLMLLAFTRLLILSTTSLDIDDVNFVLLCWSQLLFQHEEEEHKENDDDEFFENDDDETKNEELLLEIVLKGRDLKEEERAETPLNIYISFRLRCFCVWSWSSVCTKNAHQTNEEIFRVFSKKKKKEKIFTFRKNVTESIERNRRDEELSHGGSVTRINDERFSANAGRATGSFGVSTGATNSRYCFFCLRFCLIIINTLLCCSFFLFSFERINSLCAREIEFLNKKESREEIQFLFSPRSLLFRVLIHRHSFSIARRHPED
jgi:hypothetical protein